MSSFDPDVYNRLRDVEMEQLLLKQETAALSEQKAKIESSLDELKLEVSKQNSKVAERIDKIAARMTLILGFAGGVLFISSEAGGSFLRAILLGGG